MLENYDKLNLYPQFNSSNFYKQSFIIHLNNNNFSKDEINFLDNNQDGLWLIKPVDGTRGDGIEFIENLTNFKIYLKNKMKNIDYNSKYLYFKYPIIV